MESQYRLEMRGISKSFGKVRALHDVTLKIKPGEIHALVGENGAGKSTLMKILSGAYTRDEGEILVDGKLADIDSPKKSMDLGIAIIYQEFMLAPDLTVAENIFIDRLSQGGYTINWKKLRADAKEQLEKLGFSDINPSAKCGSLSVAYQQVVEICKCLARNARVLVFDEPTAVLTFKEVRKLFEIIKRLRADGVSIVYISHRMEEIFELSDEITVLKDGGYVDTLATSSTNQVELVTKMVGRKMQDMYPPRHAKIGDVVLKAEDIHAGKMVNGVSFEVHAGEVLGFYGLVGAGRTETMRAIFGADKRDSGRVWYFGREVHWKSPKQAVADKFGYLPENRKEQGLLVHQSIRMNTTLACLWKRVGKNGIIHHSAEKKMVESELANIQTKYGSTEDNANTLSGGNQQKVALAKWIAADCRCIVFDEPTRGVDVGAKVEIFNVMNALAEQGVAIIMISSEMPEIIGMSDRIVIMSNGKKTGELLKDELSEETLIKGVMGV